MQHSSCNPGCALQGRESPFLNRGNRSTGNCYAFDLGQQCRHNPCRYRHLIPPSTLGLYVQDHKCENPPFANAIILCTNNDPDKPSPAALNQVLQGYDFVSSQHLVNGFSTGFEIGCLGVPVQKGKGVKNMRSAFEFP